MKKLMIIAALAALAGCQFATLESDGDGKWKAKVCSHMFSRQFERFAADKKSSGEFSLQLNGYKGDTSEQLPLFAKEMWYGLGILGRIAATAYNPAASAVPLTDQAANAEQVAALVKANAEAKAALAKAKAEAAALKAGAATTTNATTSAECANGGCTP